MIDLAKAVMWPMVALLALLLLYSPLRKTLDSLALRSEDIQTIKLGSLELNIRVKDLPSPSPDVAKAIVGFDGKR